MSIFKLHTYLLSAFILLTLPCAALAFDKNDKDLPPTQVYGVKFVAQDHDQDNIYDGLTAYLTIKTFCTGQYAFHATLESVHGQPISSSPRFEYTSPVQDPSLSFHAAINEPPRNIQVTFSGEDIRRARVNGIYILKLMNMGQVDCSYEVNPYKGLHIASPSFNPHAFGENCGTPPRPCKDVYK
jgi:hypothetical protein|tara:strand:+ start:311293 stop:311844 length:552 start_codon:yes stop_codon:yes gene_type:complete